MCDIFRTSKWNILPWLLLSISTISCVESNADFADRLIEAFQTKSINKQKIDWIAFSTQVKESARISKDSAVVTALTLNNNAHSWYKRGDFPLKGRYPQRILNDSCASSGFFDAKFLQAVGYVRVPRLNNDFTRDPTRAKEYVLEIINKIKKQDRAELKGWIIDLRGNSGGDMWPMLIALKPFLQEGLLGSFDADGDLKQWRLKSGEIYLDGQSLHARYDIEPDQYKVFHGRAKISVLINGNTGSSGEAVAIALKSLKQVRYFGVSTFGFATSNEIISFSNGEYLILTTGYMQDIRGKKYPKGIVPDVFTCSVAELREQVRSWLDN